ncbi:MAG: nucleotide pyrophosphohydrolase [Candidatus Lokiarchaeota archaeon]|nr:nucleotide pyrophosphohydrolase [Candidatus Lokiarchaeota archaeon]MBD3201479.1 nucleotide pyrophosphohydrolase [Candidatus Lokiarchaeota archaeon]
MPDDFSKKDANTFVSFFKDKVKKFVDERGWKPYHTPINLIQAMTIELAELSEHFLFKELTQKDIRDNKELFNEIKEELADVFIYLISFINTLDIDLTSSFNKKMTKNSKKYSVDEFNNGKYYKK